MLSTDGDISPIGPQNSMKPFLEHLNMTSTDVDETIRFLLTAIPEFSIRGEGGGEGSPAQRWVHIGTEDSYLCIESRGATEKGPHKPYFHPGMNHMGFVVSDGEELAKRMLEAGYRQGATYLEHPHRHRYYFFDHDWNEYEFVQYFSEDPIERNEY